MKIKATMKYYYSLTRMAIKETVTIFSKDKENAPPLLVGMQNGTAASENSLAVSYQVQHKLTVSASNTTIPEKQNHPSTKTVSK